MSKFERRPNPPLRRLRSRTSRSVAANSEETGRVGEIRDDEEAAPNPADDRVGSLLPDRRLQLQGRFQHKVLRFPPGGRDELSPHVVCGQSDAADGQFVTHHSDIVEHHEIPRESAGPDRKSTRLNSSHLVISYAVFCLKKKN